MESKTHHREYNRLVVKVGTTTLTHPSGKINLRKIQKLACVLSDLRNMGKEVILVSSGAIAVGTERLGLDERPRDIRGKQAASAVGQAVLMQIYLNFFMEYNQKVAQILLTKDVIEDQGRKEHAKNTFSELLNLGVIPIVNENDSVAVDEIVFSDNDTLSAYVACLTESDILIMLSDTEGLFDANPKEKENANLITCIENISGEIMDMAGDSGSSLGTGGMATKVIAADMATKEGIDAVIASGSEPAILFDILEGKRVGTLFTHK